MLSHICQFPPAHWPSLRTWSVPACVTTQRSGPVPSRFYRGCVPCGRHAGRARAPVLAGGWYARPGWPLLVWLLSMACWLALSPLPRIMHAPELRWKSCWMDERLRSCCKGSSGSSGRQQRQRRQRFGWLPCKPAATDHVAGGAAVAEIVICILTHEQADEQRRLCHRRSGRSGRHACEVPCSLPPSANSLPAVCATTSEARQLRRTGLQCDPFPCALERAEARGSPTGFE